MYQTNRETVLPTLITIENIEDKFQVSPEPDNDSELSKKNHEMLALILDKLGQKPLDAAQTTFSTQSDEPKRKHFVNRLSAGSDVRKNMMLRQSIAGNMLLQGLNGKRYD